MKDIRGEVVEPFSHSAFFIIVPRPNKVLSTHRTRSLNFTLSSNEPLPPLNINLNSSEALLAYWWIWIRALGFKMASPAYMSSIRGDTKCEFHFGSLNSTNVEPWICFRVSPSSTHTDHRMIPNWKKKSSSVNHRKCAEKRHGLIAQRRQHG